MSTTTQGCLGYLLPCRKGSSVLECGWNGAGEHGGGICGGSAQSLVRLRAGSFVQKLLSWEGLVSVVFLGIGH